MTQLSKTGTKLNVTITLSQPDAEALLALLESPGLCLYPDVVEDLRAALAKVRPVEVRS